MAKKKRKRKGEGVIQTVTVRKEVAPTRKGAERLVREYFKKRTYTSRETTNTWRFRQRSPECFSRFFGQKCIPIKGVKNGVCLLYGKLKKGASKRKSCR